MVNIPEDEYKMQTSLQLKLANEAVEVHKENKNRLVDDKDKLEKKLRVMTILLEMGDASKTKEFVESLVKAGRLNKNAVPRGANHCTLILCLSEKADVIYEDLERFVDEDGATLPCKKRKGR